MTLSKEDSKDGGTKPKKTLQDIAWYERDAFKSLFLQAASNAMRGYHCAMVSPKTTFAGTNSLTDMTNHLGAFLTPGEKRVLIVVDKDLPKFAEIVGEKLKSQKQIDYKIFSNVLPDVPKHTVMEGVKICQEYNPRVIIGIGGGSAMDTAKMIMLFYEKPDINLNNVMAPAYMGLRKKIFALVAIPTTSGTGAETTFIAVVTDEERNKKVEAVLYELCPDFAVLYPEFVKTMPPALTMGTGMDALCHSMGSYVLTMSTDYTDIHNLKAIEMILKYLPRAVKRGNDMEAREQMQMAAYIAGIGFGNISGGLEHGIGHSLGATFHVHHGVCVAIFLCASLAYQAKVTDRVLDITSLFGVNVNGMEKEAILRELIIRTQAFMKEINCPLSIKDIKEPHPISLDELNEKLEILTDLAFNDFTTLSSSRKLDPPQIKKIIKIAYENKVDDLMELYRM